jgi:salicylate hydroxylase
MLPMMAQGAAQAIEDGAALASLLEAMPDDVPGALARYEAVRKPRATRLQQMSATNRTRFHLPDGPEQQKRDELMVTSGDRTFAALNWLYDHDAATAI